MGGEDPAEGEICPFGAEPVGRQTHGRGNRRDPVETIEDGECGQPDDREIGKWQRRSAIVRATRSRRTGASGYRSDRRASRKDGADKIERSDNGERPGRADRRDAEIATQRDPMRLDQAICAQPAHIEGREQDPERPTPARLIKRRSGESSRDLRARSCFGGGSAVPRRRAQGRRPSGRSRNASIAMAPAAAKMITTNAARSASRDLRSVSPAAAEKSAARSRCSRSACRPTRPRRSANQRVATVAPSTSATIPVPKPTITPQSATSCQTSVIASDVDDAAGYQRDRGSTPRRRTPNRLRRRRRTAPIRPIQSKPHRQRGGDVLRAPTEFLLQRAR